MLGKAVDFDYERKAGLQNSPSELIPESAFWSNIYVLMFAA